MTKLIEQILNIINEPNVTDGSISSYSFRNDNSPHDYITMVGADKINRYKNALRALYDKMQVEKCSMSLTCFTKILEQLVFRNSLTEENILSELKQRSCQKYTTIGKIYGINMVNQISQYGKYKFVRKDYIIDFLNSNIPYTASELFTHLKSEILAHVNEKSPSDVDFIYILITYEAFDSTYAEEYFNSELIRVVNVLRYMAGIKHERIYIDTVENKPFMNSYIQYAENGFVGEGSKINIKDIPITLDDDYFYSEENGNKQIWSLLSDSNRTSLQKRIIRSIEWAGRSINEPENDIACTEIAFAFESLLKSSKSNSPITASIQGQISETVAFICGENKDSRKHIIKKFKELYSYRSSVAHGGNSTKTADYRSSFSMFKETLIRLLCCSPYDKCNSLEEVLDKVEDIKFQ